MEESMSDACEETCRGLLRLCGIVEQLQKQICNDGGGDLQPNGIGRASVETAEFQVLLDPSEEQLDLPAGLDPQTKCDTGYVRDRHGNEIQPPQSGGEMPFAQLDGDGFQRRWDRAAPWASPFDDPPRGRAEPMHRRLSP